ncbi:IclR family transcriptional regulator [Aeromicrobium wangtongii]|uniref:IclR family transcriptional regulator n=1 Tax=Aeromicrobium wangtongii TaxID=2969247 RepID=UPI002017B58B|nr:IclR family transcriptional regulator [Aeromicrobium wangtongii]MCL3820000.1 IclR family transcriptional regulator [Aeromicrobium wangtongii]
MSDQVVGSTSSGGKSRDSGQVRAVARATRIVTALAEHPFPLGIVELAQFVQLSPASVHRILVTLVQVGWVEQNTRTAKYRLGMQAVGVGMVGLVSNPVLHDARMFLSRLAQWSGHDAVLSTLVGFKTVQLSRVAGSATEFIEFEPGHPQPAHAMADGKLLMSYMPVEQRRWLYEAEPLRMFTPNTITDPAAIEREFAAIQERGYAVDNYERFAVGRGIAAPVMDTEGRPIAAMLCLGKIDPAQDEEIVQQMLALTREMSERLKGAGDLPASALDLAEPDEEV